MASHSGCCEILARVYTKLSEMAVGGCGLGAGLSEALGLPGQNDVVLPL